MEHIGSETLPVLDRKTFDTYRTAAQALITSLKEAYPELSPDSLTTLCYVSALELQATEGYAATQTPNEFVDIACEQVIGLADQYQADTVMLAQLPASAVRH